MGVTKHVLKHSVHRFSVASKPHRLHTLPKFTPNPAPIPEGPNTKAPSLLLWGAGVVIVGGVTYHLFFDNPVKDTTLFTGFPATIRTIPSQAVEFKYLGFADDEDSMRTRIHRLMSEAGAEEKLVANAEKEVIYREGNPVQGWDTNMLASKDTTEDRFSIDLITQQDLKQLVEGEGFFWKRWWRARTAQWPKKENKQVQDGNGREDVVMFSVMDGHGGPNVSELLKKTLHGTLAWNLGQKLLTNKSQGNTWEFDKVAKRIIEGAAMADGLIPTTGSNMPDSFCQMMTSCFIALDQDICSINHNILYNQTPTDPTSTSPSLPPDSPAFLALAPLLRNGSCALTAIVDVAADKLYVANVGDTRAVAGWWNQKEGKWRCDVLTEDAMGDNPKEADRVRSEHPEEERNTSMYDEKKGAGTRVLGGLQLTKAMGDEDYKIDFEEWRELNRCLGQREPAKRWKWFEECPHKTPPYVTARPEVISRDLRPENGEELKFLILATDGLWDRTTSEEATHLVAGHLAHPYHQDIPKSQLPALIPHQPALPEGEHPFPKEEMETEGTWVFEDGNCATHLLRNTLGGGDRGLRRQFLSLRDPGVRSARDDITAIVVWFDKENATQELEGDTTST